MPRSSSHSCRVQASLALVDEPRQSRSSTWPRGQARTNRVGDDLAPVEPAFLVERLAVHQPAGALAARRRPAVLLDDDPFRKPPDADAARSVRRARSSRAGGA